jgi:hypothetical protein
MLEENVLHFLGVDVLAGHVDHVVPAPHEVVVAVGVPAHEVAGVEPAAAELPGGRLRQLPVALGQPRIAGDQLAHLIHADVTVGLVHQAHVAAGKASRTSCAS